MGAPITRVKEWNVADYDMIIDVRSPREFAEDHVPGAVNMPVLDDEQHAEIGTMYKQISPFDAKRAGAAHVARNIGHHLQSKLADADRNFKPLVYCWRGGQRSQAMAQIFSDIGWHTAVIDGGYKTHRKAVLAGLETLPEQFRLIILRGRTGTAKTRILRAAAADGLQVIDLEGLANHRGSLLGPEPDMPQPAQRLFESHLFECLRDFDPAKPVFIEAESNKVGQLHVPPALWAAMRGADSVAIEAGLDERVEFLCRDYDHIIAKPELLAPLLDWVVTRLGHDVVDGWRQMVAARDWPGFVRATLIEHYDPAYDKSSSQRNHHTLKVINVGAFDDTSIRKAAKALIAFQKSL